MQQLQPLRRHLNTFEFARTVTLPPGQFRLLNEAELDRIRSRYSKIDRNGGRRGLGCERGGGACLQQSPRPDDASQICRQCRQPIIITLQPAILDGYILALNKACFTQSFEEGLAPIAAFVVLRGCGV